MRKRDLIIIASALAAALIFGIHRMLTNVIATAAWGLSYPAQGQAPSGPASGAALAKYDAVYLGDTSQPVLYLTFDAGYENGCTAQILDVLKKHQVPAAFFLVGFLAMALVYWVATALFGEKCRLWALMIGQLLCYFLGTLWVMDTYVKQGGSASFGAVMLLTVAPYLLPDAAKLTLAWLLAKRLHRRLHI